MDSVGNVTTPVPRKRAKPDSNTSTCVKRSVRKKGTRTIVGEVDATNAARASTSTGEVNSWIARMTTAGRSEVENLLKEDLRRQFDRIYARQGENTSGDVIPWQESPAAEERFREGIVVHANAFVKGMATDFLAITGSSYTEWRDSMLLRPPGASSDTCGLAAKGRKPRDPDDSDDEDCDEKRPVRGEKVFGVPRPDIPVNRYGDRMRNVGENTDDMEESEKMRRLVERCEWSVRRANERREVVARANVPRGPERGRRNVGRGANTSQECSTEYQDADRRARQNGYAENVERAVQRRRRDEEYERKMGRGER